MPAPKPKSCEVRRALAGRRRTSPEGGNRGLRSGESEWVTIYGDLKLGWVANVLKSPNHWMLTSVKRTDFKPARAFFTCLLSDNPEFSARRPNFPCVGSSQRSKNSVFRIRPVGVIMVRLPVVGHG